MAMDMVQSIYFWHALRSSSNGKRLGDLEEFPRRPCTPQASELGYVMIRPNKLGLNHHHHLTTNLMLLTFDACESHGHLAVFLFPKSLGNYVGNKPVDSLALKAKRIYTSSLPQLSFS